MYQAKVYTTDDSECTLYLDSRTLHWVLVKFINRSLKISFMYVSTYINQSAGL